ncbi:hypothetical protein QQF45_04145 [Halopseudomonas aestusnigri]|uniref:hypothetical protein n=1 Tax=Halopseudomonas aestusnigri TaxID=857252 RepID=UPI0025546A1B|nr:hypothetical protein [Halopseudomonas aestusnigri]MDL2198249.1 hypothetical protein [Halopseudomonas aestusnigri]
MNTGVMRFSEYHLTLGAHYARQSDFHPLYISGERGMKNIFIVLVSILAGLLVAIPIYLIPLGIIYIFFKDPKIFLYMSIFYTVIFCVFWGVSILAEHPKTKKITNFFLGLLVIIFLIFAVATHESSGCRQTRYIECD